MSIVLQTKLLTKVSEHERVAWFEVITAMCPTPQRQQLREQLAEFDQSLTVTSLALLEILDGMENDRTHV
jgi:hypothetical protein